MRLYHGSKEGLEGAIRPDCGNPAADFGAGFYMGTDAHQPQTLICGGRSPVLYTLDFDPHGLRSYEFCPGIDWALFIAFCRGLVPAEHGESPFVRRYRAIRDGNDIICGKIANDRIFTTVQAFFRNELTDVTLEHALQALNLGEQVCAKTEVACRRIGIVDSRALSRVECEGLKLKAGSQRDRAVRETESIRRKYRREGIYFDELVERMAKEGLECP